MDAASAPSQGAAEKTLTLTGFLLARIAEDEEVARDVSRGQWYPWDDRNGDFYDAMRNINRKAAAHIARHDPARVLAECEARRRIVKDFEVLLRDSRVTHDLEHVARRFQARNAIAHLAAVYADHPDYREEWKP